MTRRLIAAFVATALAALLLAGLGTFLLAARADRIETESNLRSEAAELASAAASAEQPIVLRALTNAAITRLLRIDGSTFVGSHPGYLSKLADHHSGATCEPRLPLCSIPN